MATLKDLAKDLGLSVTQVSRALNGHSDVSKATLERVKEAAGRLNYMPNVSARKLVSGRSGIVGMVYWKHEGIETHPYFIETVTGLSEAFSARQMQFVLHVTSFESDVLDAYDRLISSGSLDGFIIVEPVQKDPRILHLSKKNVPFVVHGRADLAPDYPCFDIDNEWVGYQLTKTLLDHGHRQIAFINGEKSRTYAQSRLVGFEKALATVGLQPNEDWLFNGRMMENLGLVSTLRMFDNEAHRPTAIMASNTLIAKGVYAAAEALDLKVPDDLSVIAHDDCLTTAPAEAFVPSLSGTVSPLRDSWQPLADFLGRAVAGEPVEKLQEVVQPELVDRSSVAPPRA